MDIQRQREALAGQAQRDKTRDNTQVRIAAARELRDQIKSRIAAEPEGAGGAVWRGLASHVRITLVICALAPMRDPDGFARRGWASYTDDQRQKIGAVARELMRELAPAEALR